MLDWIQKVEPEILKAAGIPDVVKPPAFPLAAFAKSLASRLQIDDLRVQLGTSEWKTTDNFFSGLGPSPAFLSFQLSPLAGELFWAMSYEDLRKLTSWKIPLPLDHPDLVKGIYRFMLLEALLTVKTMGIYKDLSPKLSEGAKFDETAFAIDVSIKNGDDLLWGRLLISPTFYKAFAHHYAIKEPKLTDLTKGKGALIPLTVRAGTVSLSKKELTSLKEGDFIVLEDMYYRPSSGKGSFKLMLNDTPLFQVKWKEEKLKILDYVYSYAEDAHGQQ